MHILIAPNAFKHALDANGVAMSIQKGLLESKLPCSCTSFPVGDGGNGTCELIVDQLQGETIHVWVSDPLGRVISAPLGFVHHGQTAVIEMANASGLHLLEQQELDPLHANTYGTGQLIKAALDKGVKKIIMGMGGSATVDGGSGILMALGVRFLDKEGHELTKLPIDLKKLHTIDRSTMDRRLTDCELTILCDVTTPLLGENGAAHVFGPQKGATPETVMQLDAILSHYAEIIEKETGVSISNLKSGGVAGGASAGLNGILGAKLVNGIDYFLDLTQFDEYLQKCNLVITAEGSIDHQTLHGKGPYGVAKRAKALGLTVIGLAGRIPSDVDAALYQYFDVLLAIGNEPSSLEEALSATARNLERVAMQIGNIIA